MTRIGSGVTEGDSTFTLIYLAWSGKKKKIFISKQSDVMDCLPLALKCKMKGNNEGF